MHKPTVHDARRQHHVVSFPPLIYVGASVLLTPVLFLRSQRYRTANRYADFSLQSISKYLPTSARPDTYLTARHQGNGGMVLMLYPLNGPGKVNVSSPSLFVSLGHGHVRGRSDGRRGRHTRPERHPDWKTNGVVERKGIWLLSFKRGRLLCEARAHAKNSG